MWTPQKLEVSAIMPWLVKLTETTHKSPSAERDCTVATDLYLTRAYCVVKYPGWSPETNELDVGIL